MATTNFNLREPRADKPTPINLVFRYQKERLVHATGLKVLPKYWNAEKGRVKNTYNVHERDSINAVLSDLEAQADLYFAESMAKRVFSLDGLKKHLEKFQGKTNEARKLNFFEYFQKFIAESSKRTQTENGKLITPGTIAKYKTTLSLITEFSKGWRRKVDFKNIDLEFYKDFTEFLQTRSHNKGIGYSNNAIGKHIQTLKTVLNSATENGANEHNAYQSKKFKVLKEESDNVYLTENELKVLENLDLSKNQRLERVRDLFLIGCWTGLRFSDLSSLDTSKHVKDTFIEIEQAKTGGKVVIPLHPVVKAILSKYEKGLPPFISNQKYNDYVKEVCQLAGITEQAQKGITRGGLRVLKFCEKWELVSSHTARRTFATNAYKKGIPALTIRQITGHKTESAFLKYIKATPEEHAKIISMYWEMETNQNDNPLKIVAQNGK